MAADTVDAAHQIIVAAEMTTDANDNQQVVPMAQAAVANIAAADIERARDEQGEPMPIPNTADTGYFGVAKVQGVTEAGLDPYFAVGRDKHHASEAAPCSDIANASAGASSTLAGSSSSGTADENPKTAMAKRVRATPGRTLYAARKHIVESVFGQIKRIHGFRKFLLRGLENVSAKWPLICLTHNLLKIWIRVIHGFSVGFFRPSWVAAWPALET